MKQILFFQNRKSEIMFLNILQNMQHPYADSLFVRERQTKLSPQQNITFSEKRRRWKQKIADTNAKPQTLIRE